MWQRLCEVLDRAAAVRVLVLGDYMIDRYLYGDAERISPEAPVPVLRVVRQHDALGGAGSVAADVAALGAKAHCVGVLGDDADGKLLGRLLDEAGADSSGVVAVPGRPTTRKTRLIGLAQHRHRQQLIRIDDESAEPISGAVAAALLSQVERLIGSCHVVCIEDYHKGVVTETVAQAVIAAARRRGLAVLVDPASVADYRTYAGATLVTPNRTETEKLTGLSLRTLDAVRAAASTILTACRTDHVCVTLDADGSALIGPGGAFEHIPTKKRDVYDVTGAGDEVLATLAVALAAGGDLREAAALANIAGGLEVEKFGCVPVSRQEVIGELLLEHGKALGKVRTLDQLLPELARRRALHETIAFTNGCFDILHAGHVATFAFAKQHANVLVVAVNSDASVRSLGKDDDRPIVDQQRRAALLAALADVDYVTIFDEPTPAKLIEAVRPEVLVKGQDWEGRPIIGRETVEKHGGRVLLAPLVEGCSTTEIIRRIRDRR